MKRGDFRRREWVSLVFRVVRAGRRMRGRNKQTTGNMWDRHESCCPVQSLLSLLRSSSSFCLSSLFPRAEIKRPSNQTDLLAGEVQQSDVAGWLVTLGSWTTTSRVNQRQAFRLDRFQTLDDQSSNSGLVANTAGCLACGCGGAWKRCLRKEGPQVWRRRERKARGDGAE